MVNLSAITESISVPTNVALWLGGLVISGLLAWGDLKSDVRSENTLRQQQYVESIQHREAIAKSLAEAKEDLSRQAASDKREIRGDIRELRSLLMIPPQERQSAVARSNIKPQNRDYRDEGIRDNNPDKR